MNAKIINGDCKLLLSQHQEREFDLAFLDPPFNQSKDYRNHDDDMSPKDYWDWMKEICHLVYQKSSQGSAIYFMQREKNAHHVIQTLLDSGWTYQNLIIWKKKTSAIPSNIRYGKHYQVIAFATKGKSPRVFNKLRIDPPLLETEKYRRPTGMYVTDVWDDIRELTSGYLAGEEPLRDKVGERLHKQQSPVHLLLRIILSSSNVGDLVFDPFAGTGTTLVVSKQLQRESLGIEIDPINVKSIESRLSTLRSSDIIEVHRHYYRYTKNLKENWPVVDKNNEKIYQKSEQLELL